MKNAKYIDLNINFKPHPVTGNPVTVKDVDSIKQSLKNIVMTNTNEKIYNPLFFTNVTYSLFENLDSADIVFIKNKILYSCQTYEKRAEITNIDIKNSLDLNTVEINIKFIIKNNIEEYELDIILERIR